VHRVLLADDHALVRQGLRAILEGFQDVSIVGEASNGVEAVSMVDACLPDVILMDVNMPKMDGIEATKRIKDAHPSAIVIGLSVNDSTHIIKARKEAGAAKFVSKDVAAEALHDALNACHPLRA
jgi:DNA-binding NarL/FixJ family response regulator